MSRWIWMLLLCGAALGWGCTASTNDKPGDSADTADTADSERDAQPDVDLDGTLDTDTADDVGGDVELDTVIPPEQENYGITGSTAERLVEVPCGETTFDAVITQSGTDTEWLRYRPVTPGCVTIAGGPAPTGFEYFVLDGFTIDARLDSSATKRGVVVRSNNVGIENCEIIGPLDVVTNVTTCIEETAQSTGVTLTGRNFVWVDGSDIHGFSMAVLTAGTQQRISRNYIHNNADAISPKGREVYLLENVLWMNPSHGLVVEENAPDVATHQVRVERNLIVESEESLHMYGGAAYDFVGNTWFDESSVECGLGLGIDVLDRSPMHQSPSGPLTFVDNFMGGDGDADHFYLFEVDIASVLTASDFNVLYRPGGSSDVWTRNAGIGSYTLDEWQAQFGLDGASRQTAEDPLFENPRIEPVPATYAEAWARFAPAPESPLCGAGVGGGDVGAVPCR